MQRRVTIEERVAELEKENAALRAALEKALKELDEWKRGFRERGKRRSSRAEGRRPQTGSPGRKTGHEGAQREVPKQVDRTVEYPAPKRCSCGGAVEPTGETRSTLVEDIPPVRVEVTEHIAHVGCCQRCGMEVAESLPGGVRSGASIARTQVGPNAASMAVSLRFEHHVALAGIATFMGAWLACASPPGASRTCCRAKASARRVPSTRLSRASGARILSGWTRPVCARTAWPDGHGLPAPTRPRSSGSSFRAERGSRSGCSDPTFGGSC